MRYPIPDLLTKNSPIITPIRDIEIFSFKDEIIVTKELGIINLKIILNLKFQEHISATFYVAIQ